MTDLVTPSGAIYRPDDLELLRYAARVKFVAYNPQPFTLKSGVKSNVYVYGREDLTDNPGFEWLVGRKLAQVVCQHTEPETPQPCLIGIPTAGTALSQAAAMVSWRERILTPSGQVVCHRTMRETLKSHGAHPDWVNGRATATQRYWVVDNVATNGDSKVEVLPKLRQSGYLGDQEFPPVLIFVDRQQGAVERLTKAGFNTVVVAYQLLDLAFAFQHMGLWPREVVQQVEEEIRAHQFRSDDAGRVANFA
jgi:orotate phosphoribosyltransferase